MNVPWGGIADWGIDFPNLTNNGLIWNEGTSGQIYAIYGNNLDLITNNGDIVALATSGFAHGFATNAWGVLHNHGNIIAISADGNAEGFVTSHELNTGHSPGLTHENSGLIEAWAGASAEAVRLNRGGFFENSGTIRAQGQTGATAVSSGSYSNVLINSGLIEAHSGSGNSVGIELNHSGGHRIENTGTIRAETAIHAIVSDLMLRNESGGLIEGDVVLAANYWATGAVMTVFNNGLIRGDVTLSRLDDAYTQLNGQLNGTLNLGDGNDTANTNIGTDVIFGGGGDDEIHSGADEDRLAGGAGADILDGGADFDLADYSTSSAGVTIDLGAGTASGGDAQGDTLTSIEGLIGSAHDDSLTGDTGNNVFYASGGMDVVDGAAGTDTVYFSGLASDYTLSTDGSGNTVVTDNRAGAPDGVTTLIGIETITYGVSAAQVAGGKTAGPDVYDPADTGAATGVVGIDPSKPGEIPVMDVLDGLTVPGRLDVLQPALGVGHDLWVRYQGGMLTLTDPDEAVLDPAGFNLAQASDWPATQAEDVAPWSSDVLAPDLPWHMLAEFAVLSADARLVMPEAGPVKSMTPVSTPMPMTDPIPLDMADEPIELPLHPETPEGW
jgi:Ca2+-binding RTX toxin-like protein